LTTSGSPSRFLLVEPFGRPGRRLTGGELASLLASMPLATAGLLTEDEGGYPGLAFDISIGNSCEIMIFRKKYITMRKFMKKWFKKAERSHNANHEEIRMRMLTYKMVMKQPQVLLVVVEKVP
jgi:hypothetical protein